MRLQLQLSPNTHSVPFDHLHNLIGAIHKWLGPNNDQHDGISLYSFGWLRGGESRNGALQFSHGTTWNISFYDDKQSRLLLRGILNDPSVGFGMGVTEVCEVNPPHFRNTHQFLTDGSAILARQKRADGSRAYLLYDDPATDAVLTGLLRKKLTAAGFAAEEQTAQVRFDRSYAAPRTRKITIKGIHHKGSECPVIVEGTPDELYVAWTVGLGDLTGSGFGALR